MRGSGESIGLSELSSAGLGFPAIANGGCCVAILPWPQISSIVAPGSMGTSESTLPVFLFWGGFLVQVSFPVALLILVFCFSLPAGPRFSISSAALLSILTTSVASALFSVFPHVPGGEGLKVIVVVGSRYAFSPAIEGSDACVPGNFKSGGCQVGVSPFPSLLELVPQGVPCWLVRLCVLHCCLQPELVWLIGPHFWVFWVRWCSRLLGVGARVAGVVT